VGSNPTLPAISYLKFPAISLIAISLLKVG